MKHLLICREYPPALGGGIGVYAARLSRLLAESGESVHVICQLWRNAESPLETECHGRLIIHRLPFEDWASLLPRRPHPDLEYRERGLFKSNYPAQCFSWQAAQLAERIIEQYGIDVVEGQDYEAPLYYFQLRRALGMGPLRRPPCFVHLHSPTHFIAQHNDWSSNSPAVLIARRLEAYSIGAADRLLSPSRYLARQVENAYRFPSGSIEVIPYPLGEDQLQQRDEGTWAGGSICYVGRLERRKGVIEFVEAAISIARQHPGARFEFVGGDTFDDQNRSVRQLLERKIPNSYRNRFRFHGHLNGPSLLNLLKGARIAVVPSRWENFPNTCIEAMQSGLPVIATREGGMAEMISDGRSGWLSRQPTSEALAETLTRALNTSPERLADMGRNARVDIAKLCDNKTIVSRHRAFREELLKQGPKHSARIPANIPSTRRTLKSGSKSKRTKANSARGIALVLICSDIRPALEKCFESIQRQSNGPIAVAVVAVGSSSKARHDFNGARARGWHVVHIPNCDSIRAKAVGMQAIFSSGLNPLGFAFLDGETCLESTFIEVCQSVLQHSSDIGIVSGWVARSDKKRVWSTPCPDFPWQWLSNEVAPFSVMRTDCLRDVLSLATNNKGFNDWALCNAVMASGWIAVTVPDVLGRHRDAFQPSGIISKEPPEVINAMHREMLNRYPDLNAHNASQFAQLRDQIVTSSSLRQLPLSGTLALLRVMARYPRTSAGQIYSRLRSKALRNTRRGIS